MWMARNDDRNHFILIFIATVLPAMPALQLETNFCDSVIAYMQWPLNFLLFDPTFCFNP